MKLTMSEGDIQHGFPTHHNANLDRKFVPRTDRSYESMITQGVRKLLIWTPRGEVLICMTTQGVTHSLIDGSSSAWHYE